MGYYANNIASPDGIIRYDVCPSCPRGTLGIKQQAKNLLDGCKNCTSGKFSEFEGSDDSTCKGCPKGKWSSDIGAQKESVCINCIPGTYGLIYKGANAESSCTKCSKGRFSIKVGAFGVDSCEKCPSGYVGNEDMGGSTACNSVPPGFYTFNATAKVCERGHYCKGKTANQTACEPGLYTNNANSVSCISCLRCDGKYLRTVQAT